MAVRVLVRMRVRGGELVRNPAEVVRLYDASQLTGKWRDWTSKENVSRRKAERLVASGKAEALPRMVDGSLTTIYRRTTAERVLHRSATTLTRGTMDAVADAVGDEKETAAARKSAHVLKFKVWAVVPDTWRDAEGNFVEGGVYKAATIRPKLPLEQRTAAEALLAAGAKLGYRVRPAAVAGVA